MTSPASPQDQAGELLSREEIELAQADHSFHWVVNSVGMRRLCATALAYHDAEAELAEIRAEIAADKERHHALWRMMSRLSGYRIDGRPRDEFVQVCNGDLLDLDRLAHEIPVPAELVSAEAELARLREARDHWQNEFYARTQLMDDRVHALTEALEKRTEEWQPIETAPEDGTLILITRPTRWPEDRFHVVRWDDDWWMCHNGKNKQPLRGLYPTHWRSLPPVSVPQPEEEHRG